MDQTIPGGCYLLNGSYVDANGEPVSAEGVAAFEELQAANALRVAAIEDQLRQANLTPAQALAQILQAPPVLPVETPTTTAKARK